MSWMDDLKNLLLTVTPNVHHNEATGETGSYIVWAEDSARDGLYADNILIEQVIQGTIDYFTHQEYDPVLHEIQEKLDSAEWLCWYLNSIQKERDTGYTHYEWVFEVVNDNGDNDS